MRRPTPNLSVAFNKVLAILASLMIVLAAGPATSYLANMKRLKAMPPDLRQRLLENLKQFDRLPAEEREQIVELDRALAALPELDRERFNDVLRRYHMWLQTQSDDARRSLQALEPAARLARIEELRAKAIERAEVLKRNGFQDALQISSLTTETLRLSAFELRIWLALQPEQRAAFLKAPNPVQQHAQFREATLKMPELEALRQALGAEFGIDENEMRELSSRRIERKKGQLPPKADLARRAIDRGSELKKYLRGNNGLAPVSNRNVTRFEDAMPPWIRETLDALPPEAARRRIQLLYRLVFPAPQELPEPKPQPSTKKSTSASDPSMRPF